jgi:hypothetical protein
MHCSTYSSLPSCKKTAIELWANQTNVVRDRPSRASITANVSSAYKPESLQLGPAQAGYSTQLKLARLDIETLITILMLEEHLIIRFL